MNYILWKMFKNVEKWEKNIIYALLIQDILSVKFNEFNLLI